MSADDHHAVRDQAIDWHIRLRHGTDETWDAFADWLAEDPGHAKAYALIAETDADLQDGIDRGAILFPSASANENAPPAHGPRPARLLRAGLFGGLLAASAAAVLLFLPSRESRYEVATGPGEHRQVALENETVLDLNGSTRILLDRANPRYARLVEGEVLLRVRHDGAKPFTIEVGGDRIQDAGTVFNVAHDAHQTRVAVAEGAVVYNPGKTETRLAPGDQLIEWHRSDRQEVQRIAPSAVGGWQRGQLVYSGEPLTRVVNDLERSLGVTIELAPELASRKFFGAITLDDSGPGQLARLGAAMNVNVEGSGRTWTMRSVRDGTR